MNSLFSELDSTAGRGNERKQLPQRAAHLGGDASSEDAEQVDPAELRTAAARRLHPHTVCSASPGYKYQAPDFHVGSGDSENQAGSKKDRWVHLRARTDKMQLLRPGEEERNGTEPSADPPQFGLS